MRSYDSEILRECECSCPCRAEAAWCQVADSGGRGQLAWGGNLSQGKISKVDTASKEVMAKLGGAAKLVGNSLGGIHPVQ